MPIDTAQYNLTFAHRVTHNDIYIYSDCADFSSNPNLSFSEFKRDIEAAVHSKALKHYKAVQRALQLDDCYDAEGRAYNDVCKVSDILNGVLNDALASGTWLDVDGIYEMPTYKVVNMANYVKHNR